MLDDVTGTRGLPAYYDRKGERISMRRWSELRNDPSYKILRTTTVGDKEVITAWLGSDQMDALEDEEPFIFGTVTRLSDGSKDVVTEEFSISEEDALSDHEAMVASLGCVAA
jgi:hypothetical protein